MTVAKFMSCADYDREDDSGFYITNRNPEFVSRIPQFSVTENGRLLRVI